MSGEPERIDPSGIPVFTGHLDTLAEKYTALRSDAEGIRGIGQAVDEQFQGLSGPYQAPEAADLLATTTPVRQRACAFADKLEMVALVLEIFAEEARPLINRLDRLRGEAEAFVDEIGDGDDWRHDGDKTARNNELLREVSVTVAQFWEVERRAANNITLLVDGTTWVTDDGNGDAGTYGLSVADIEQVGETPWGRAVEEKHHAWELWHHAKSFVWDGIVVDGILGTLTGISTLVNPWSDGFGAAWQGLGKLATGVLVSSPTGLPLLAANQLLPDNPVSDWINDSVKARIEMTTGLVAWDTWSEDPARAAGATTFNLLTLVGTAGAGTAANTAGAAARAARIAGTAGRYLDPTTPLINGISAAVGSLPRLSGLTSGLANATTIPATPLPDGAYRLPDGSRLPADFTAADLPPGISALDVSDGTVAIPRSDTPGLGAGGVIDPATGNIVYPDGTLTRPDGTILQHADEAPGELPARTDSPELAAVGAHNGPGGLREVPVDSTPPGAVEVGHGGPPGRGGTGGGGQWGDGPTDAGEATPSRDARAADDGPGGQDDAEVGRGPDDAADEQGGGWGGADWVTQPSEAAGRSYEHIRATPNRVDLPEIARNTGVDESVLRRVKSHLFRSQHDVAIAPGEIRRGLFEPSEHYANLWLDARAGRLDAGRMQEFRSLVAHEYIESRLMEAGLPYLRDHPDLWALEGDGTHRRLFPDSLERAAAHELAPHSMEGHFRHWQRRFGLEPPSVSLSGDLSNLDAVVKDILRRLREEGVDLR